MDSGLTHYFDALIEALAAKVADKIKATTPTVGGVGIKQRLLSVRGAARYLGRTEGAVRHLVATGRIPRVEIDGRIFVDVYDLVRVIEESKTAA